MMPGRPDVLLRHVAQRASLAPPRVNVAVGAAVTSLAVTFAPEEPDTAYDVAIAVGWNAAAWTTNKATTGCTLNFSAAPGGGGSTCGYFVFRSEV
jgi:hypothetical protein